MIDTGHLIKVAAAWATIAYLVCFGGVALFPAVRTLFALYALHINVNLGESVTTPGIFISGLVIWNIVAILAAGLFALLFNKIPHST